MQQRFQNSPYHMDPTHFHSTELGKILQLVSDPKSDILGGHFTSLSQINSQKMAFSMHFWMAVLKNQNKMGHRKTLQVR